LGTRVPNSADPTSTTTGGRPAGDRSPVTTTTGAEAATASTIPPELAEPGDWWKQFLQGTPLAPSSPPDTHQDGVVAAPPASGAGHHSKAPLVAGTVASFAVLIFGGGFIWWRNRASRYWPA
jgi:hypothetical protein